MERVKHLGIAVFRLLPESIQRMIYYYGRPFFGWFQRTFWRLHALPRTEVAYALQFDREGNSELSCEVVDAFLDELREELLRNHNVLLCERRDGAEGNCPILVPCIVATRLIEDITCTLDTVSNPGNDNILLVVFHPRAGHDTTVVLPTRDRVPQGQRCQVIVDVPFDPSTGQLKDTAANSEAFKSVAEHLARRVRENKD